MTIHFDRFTAFMLASAAGLWIGRFFQDVQRPVTGYAIAFDITMVVLATAAYVRFTKP